MEEKLLSVEDVCDYLGIGRDTIYKWLAAKSLPAYRLGRLWKFKKKASALQFAMPWSG
jgi:excisionase family DNA binding protein